MSIQTQKVSIKKSKYSKNKSIIKNQNKMSIQTHKVYYKKKFSIQTKKSLFIIFKKVSIQKKNS
jgi:hypothetical protein